MKKLLILLFLSLTLFGANIDRFADQMGFERDYKTALAMAQKENKLLVMVLSLDYCPWCRKFEHKTLSSSYIKPILDERAVTLVVDKNFDVMTFPKKFQTQITPRIFFINPHNEEILLDGAGYIKKKKFEQNIIDADKKFRGSNE